MTVFPNMLLYLNKELNVIRRPEIVSRIPDEILIRHYEAGDPISTTLFSEH